MDDRIPPRLLGTCIAIAGLVVAFAAAAGSASPFVARAGLPLATAAAKAWASDATLVYIENDEGLDAAGASPRWGYLFYSASQQRARVWSLRADRVVEAENLDMRFDAPPVTSNWLDSGAALAAAERAAGAEFRRASHGTLETMLLMRGAFSDSDPDRTTWTFVYRAPGAPSLFVVVDAADGKVQRTWRG